MMLTKETIRKAVELADGWHISSDDEVFSPVDDRGGEWCDALSHVWLDALAAQLVRQVDAFEGVHVAPLYGGTQMWKTDGGVSRPRELCIIEGDDRTENTINAIVEFYEALQEQSDAD